ncbi:MAG TPA: MBL fold metallo-hydrolase [Bryobacteraceae bacterium]|nr:MBL fold metallo-hydrolase [Bryobacteraceae bacterium]
MRRAIFLLPVLLTALRPPAISAQTKTLEVYVVDVEGGNATLFVSPNRESLLIDTGNAGAIAAPRDAGRIVEAVKDAGLTQIDHLIVTHWHGDHFGGLAELAKQVPIKEYIDHGPNVQPGELADNFLRDTYPQLTAKAKHTVAKPGDKIAMTGVDIRVVASADQMIKTPLPGAGKPNPYCASFKAADANAEDPQSVAVHIGFGKFRTVHLGDLSKNEEFKLMCPNNLLGTVDVLLGLHHGVGTSNSIVMVHGLHPRVAIMNNGTRKGGDPETMQTIHSSPGLEDLWQIHFSALSGQEYTVPGMFIANTVDNQPAALPIAPVAAPAPGPNVPPPPAHDGKAYWIKLSAQQDGTFTVTNARNGFSKTYKPGL